MSEIRLAYLTWPEVEAAIAGGARTVVLPCGAIEQHGPHLPLLVDTASASALALEVARRLGDALVAPTLHLGCSDHHLPFAGTLSLRAETFEAVYRDCCASLARHGFTEIVCFSWHGGNFAPLKAIEADLDAAAGPDCRVVAWTDLDAYVVAVRGAIEERLGLGDRVGGHADIFESSTMSYLHPELVRRDRAEAGYIGPIDDALFERLFTEGMTAISANGVLGDPRGMDADAGRECIARLADLVVASVREPIGAPRP